MNEPIKIIHKYKNNYRKIHYNVYIFLGQLVPNNIKKILEKIQDTKLYESLIALELNEIKTLEKYYGEYWYSYFFISKHIEYTFDIIIKNPQRNKEIVKKFGNDWYNKHMNYLKVKEKTMYSFQSIVKKEKEIKDRILLKQKKITTGEEISDFTTKQIIQSGGLKQFGGEVEEDEEEVDEDVEESITDLLNVEDTADVDTEANVDELEELYKSTDAEIDKNAITTSKLLNEIVEMPKKGEQFVNFDMENMDVQTEEDEKNIYKKNYIYSQYIFGDDTIRQLKNKITCSVINNEKLVGNYKHLPYLLPTRQYLWAEHRFIDIISGEHKKEKVMVGQKWIRRNELLVIDIEPNENIHIYENLRGNLKYLKDSMKKYGSKIKRDDDEYTLINDYKDFMTLNEIYMMDIYNDLGLNYVPQGDDKNEVLKNLYDVYIRIYYNGISSDEFAQIIEYLNVNSNNRKNEILRIQGLYNTLNNDILMENEISRLVEESRLENDKYKEYYKESYITQSVVYVNIAFTDIYKSKASKIDLFRIFDTFIVDETYPFIEFLAPDSQIVFKFYSDNKELDKETIMNKWFENAPYGLSFKVKVNLKGDKNNKYISINLNENGRIEYKTQWKEEDLATIDDVYQTFDYVKQLLEKINSENKKIQLKIPYNDDYKFAFINKIESFVFPGKSIINHNDLSDFARFFYPYISLVIDPRKRISKKVKFIEDKSKYGTYLRYKRVTNYESKAKLEERIKHFFRNYEFNDKDLSIELSKQFNITDKQAYDAIIAFRNKYPNIRKSRKVLKKLENLPKYKPPGINIDIQGKSKESYKIRISGARNKQQMENITNFVHILLYLYYDTYLEKNPKRKYILDKLKQLTHIARRRNKVEEFIDVEEVESRTIKEMTSIDKSRIGYKPTQGQNQWSRLCQNSGTKKRQPKLFTSENMAALTEAGYKYNPENKQYERKIIQGKKEIIIKAFQAKTETGTIFYTCSPEENKRYFYVGFLSKSNNPHGHCMPCCFKKNAEFSRNKGKKSYHKKCMGELDDITSEKKIIGDKLYILQDTNKLQEAKFGFLPKYLDIFFNSINRKHINIKNHFLLDAKDGYFFKFGIKQDEYNFLRSICNFYEMSLEELKDKLINILENDKEDIIFTSLNAGNIKTQFKTRENYRNYIKTNEYLPLEYFYDIVSLPGVISTKGMNILLFEKKKKVIYENGNTRDKKIKDDFIMKCNTSIILNIDKDFDNIIILKDDELYFPIFEVNKKGINGKVDINRIFKKDDEIIKQIYNYYVKNCQNDIMKILDKHHSDTTARMLNDKLEKLDKKYNVSKQLIDNRNKVKYLILENGSILPTKPSGSIYNIKIERDINKYIKNLYDSLDNLMKINELIGKVYNINGLLVDDNKKEKFTVFGIQIEDLLLPVKDTNSSKSEVDNLMRKYNIKEISLDKTPLYDLVDIEIINNNFVIDSKTIESNKTYYEEEAYQIFRLELSDYLLNNDTIKKKIMKVMDLEMDNQDKRKILRGLVFSLVNNKLGGEYEKYFGVKDITGGNIKEQTGGSKDMIIIRGDIDYSKFKKKNVLEICEIHKKKEGCNENIHCVWDNNMCRMGLNIELAIKFVNKVVEEFIENGIKASDILRRDNYYVSDIVNYDIYTHRDKQKIIKSTGVNTKKLLSELFGEDNIPIIGRRKQIKGDDIVDENYINPLKKFGEQYIQNIIPNNISVYRAIANAFYWLTNKLYSIEYRNLGYYSVLQTDLANYLKGSMIDYLNSKSNRDILREEINKMMKIDKNKYEEVLMNIILEDINNSEFKIELLVFNIILGIPINVYDEYQNLVFGYDKGRYISKPNENKEAINLQYFYYTNKYPSTISVIYF
jgi:hypothetical protein